MIKIRNRFTKEIIFETDRAVLTGADLSGKDLSFADLSGAVLSGANLSRADLSRANLSFTDLSFTDLSGADLSGAVLNGAALIGANLSRADLSFTELSGVNLSGANLSRVDLSGTDLGGAKNISMRYRTNLNILKSCKQRQIAYKFLQKDLISPYQSYKYKVGMTYESKNSNNDILSLCGEGINLATLEWCVANRDRSDLIGEFTYNPKDLIIPFNSDGKFRIKSGGKVKFRRILSEQEVQEILNDN